MNKIKPARRKIFAPASILLFILVCLIIFIAFRKNTTTPLPAEAIAAISSGLQSARQEDWISAVNYFKEAQEIAPLEPSVLFNLALACDKAGNREIRSIAWYKAYLILDPRAQNAGVVRERIEYLESVVRERAANFVREIEALLNEIPCGNYELWDWYKYTDVVRAQLAVAAEDISMLIDRLDRINKECGYGIVDYCEVIEALAKSGEIEKARQLMDRIAAEYSLLNLQTLFYGSEIIAQAQADSGDTEGAKETIKYMVSKLKVSPSQKVIVALIKARDSKGAEEIAELINKEKDLDEAVSAFKYIARAYMDTGNRRGVKKSLEIVRECLQKDYNQKKDEKAFYNNYCGIAMIEAESGDIEQAEETLAFIDKNYWSKHPFDSFQKGLMKSDVLLSIITAYFKEGNFARAEKEIPLLKDSERNLAYLEKARALARQHKFRQTEEILMRGEMDAYKLIKLDLRRFIAEKKGKAIEAKVFEIYINVERLNLNYLEEPLDFLQFQDNKNVTEFVTKLANLAENSIAALKELKEE
jgi:hypothetical protein